VRTGDCIDLMQRIKASAEKHRLNWCKYIEVAKDDLLKVESDWIYTLSRCTQLCNTSIPHKRVEIQDLSILENLPFLPIHRYKYTEKEHLLVQMKLKHNLDYEDVEEIAIKATQLTPTMKAINAYEEWVVNNNMPGIRVSQKEIAELNNISRVMLSRVKLLIEICGDDSVVKQLKQGNKIEIELNNKPFKTDSLHTLITYFRDKKGKKVVKRGKVRGSKRYAISREHSSYIDTVIAKLHKIGDKTVTKCLIDRIQCETDIDN
jgi:hypothetical protein